MTKPCYIATAIDRDKNMIFVESRWTSKEADLSRLFREVESKHYKPHYTIPWRVIYKNAFGVDYEVKLDHTRWPRSYSQWDRRYNPYVKTERWHGHMWDTLEESA